MCCSPRSPVAGWGGLCEHSKRQPERCLYSPEGSTAIRPATRALQVLTLVPARRNTHRRQQTDRQTQQKEFVCCQSTMHAFIYKGSLSRLWLHCPHGVEEHSPGVSLWYRPAPTHLPCCAAQAAKLTLNGKRPRNTYLSTRLKHYHVQHTATTLPWTRPPPPRSPALLHSARPVCAALQ